MEWVKRGNENTTHQVKKLNLDDLKHFRDRFDVPLTDEDLQEVPYYRPEKESPEISYMLRNRERLGAFAEKNSGFWPTKVPELILSPIGRKRGTRDQFNHGFRENIFRCVIKKRQADVPIVPDEARNF